MKFEWLARGLLILALVGGGMVAVGGRWLNRTPVDTVTVHARMPEAGGWAPETLRATVGQPLNLRFTSDDVVHGFAVGQTPWPAVDIHPGEWTETELTFDHPGRYTYYCTRWCGPNHWRMRGVIEVSGPGEPPAAGSEPRYVQLGIDLDAPHPAEAVPSGTPSPRRGEMLADRLPAWALTDETYWSNSPSHLWVQLRAEPALSDLDDGALWDAVAWIWYRHTSPEKLAQAAELYRKFGAASHGEAGRGDGVGTRDLPPYQHDHATYGNQAMRPPDFTDASNMLGASPALLEGKTLRGGMGTGMPSWGAIFTSEQIDGLVSYIYTFTLLAEVQPQL